MWRAARAGGGRARRRARPTSVPGLVSRRRRPPRIRPTRSTRLNSRRPRARSAKNCKPSWHTTASNAPSLNGSAWPSVASTWSDPRPSRARAASSMAGEMSVPTTSPAGVTREAAPSAASPAPVATSSTRHPAVTSAAASSAGHEQTGPAADVLLVGCRVDGPPGRGVESGVDALVHQRSASDQRHEQADRERRPR